MAEEKKSFRSQYAIATMQQSILLLEEHIEEESNYIFVVLGASVS